MATTYVAPKASNGVQPRLDVHDDTSYAEFDIAAAVVTAANGGGGAGGTAFVINDIVQMIKVQNGTVIAAVIFSCDFLDTGTAVVTAVGDGGDVDRFIEGSTVGRSSTAGVQAMNKHEGHLYAYTVDDTIDIKVTTAATTGSVTGKLRLSIRLTQQQ